MDRFHFSFISFLSSSTPEISKNSINFIRSDFLHISFSPYFLWSCEIEATLGSVWNIFTGERPAAEAALLSFRRPAVVTHPTGSMTLQKTSQIDEIDYHKEDHSFTSTLLTYYREKPPVINPSSRWPSVPMAASVRQPVSATCESV